MKRLLSFLGAAILLAGLASAQTARRIAMVWEGGRPHGRVSVRDGALAGLPAGGGFAATADGPFRLEFEVRGTAAQYGTGSTLLTTDTDRGAFSFFLRDVRAAYPVYVPAYGVAVTEGTDGRSYRQIENAVRQRGLQSKRERIESEPEESFEHAAAGTRRQYGQTWLGLSRDIRFFALSERLDLIEPHFHGEGVPLPQTKGEPSRYEFLMGRGWGASDHIDRRLEAGVLPIVHGTLVDDDIRYELTAFAGLEKGPLTAEALRGTHYLVADGNGYGHMFTKEQQAEFDRLLPIERNQPEETVLYARVTALNTAAVPRYAFLRVPRPVRAEYAFDGAKGFGTFKQGGTYVVARLNGKPLAQEEVAIQIEPGRTATLEFYVPHRPLPAERAANLQAVSFDERHAACRAFWGGKLASAAQVRVPERRISEMIQAGLLHLDLITYGLEPKGTLTSTIGVYSAIGSESSPIIQLLDSMGWHDTARRAIQYFLDKQHEDGFMQNFGGYMLETGAVLWTMGEHYRYTRDDAWVREVRPKLLKSCEFLWRWRERNMREDLRGKGYGMLEGKVADPEDPFRSYMLNGYAYLGLSRAAEMLKAVDPAQSERWSKAAGELKEDIRKSLFEEMGRSPLIPLASGSWIPTAPPWAASHGPLMLYADGGNWFSHGTMTARDSLLGPLYLVFQEVVDPKEPAGEFLLDSHGDLMTSRNAAFSQPYYSRHSIVHLRRGEVKPFLETYYNTMSALADRETYSFWEHFYHVSPHKTHEEGWFLMDTRWMLYMERGDTLDLLPGIPRAWLEDGKQILLRKVASYFGPVSLEVDSRVDQGRLEARIECPGDRRPKAVELRLPHPQGRHAVRVEGGTYDPGTERVRIEPFSGEATVRVLFK